MFKKKKVFGNHTKDRNKMCNHQTIEGKRFAQRTPYKRKMNSA